MFRSHLSIACIILLPAGCSRGATMPGVRDTQYTPQTFVDDFNGDSLDPARWVRVFDERDNGNRRNANYTRPEAVTVGDGLLRIRTWTEGSGPARQHFTGAIATGDRPTLAGGVIPTPLFAQKQGYFDARIRFLNTSAGQWSSFWVHSWNMEDPALQNIRDPKLQGMEMDIIEHTSSTRTQSGYTYPGTSGYQAAIFSGGYGASSVQQKKAINQVGAGEGFHTYGMLWTPENYTFFFDERPVWTIAASTVPPTSPLEQVIILSSEVLNGAGGIGGAGANSLPEGYGPLGASTNPVMEVDWVRVRTSRRALSASPAEPMTATTENRAAVPEPAKLTPLAATLLAFRRRGSSTTI